MSKQLAQAKFKEYHQIQRSYDEVYTDGFKINEHVGDVFRR